MKQFYQKAGIQLLVDDVITTHDFTLIGRDDITSNPQRKSLQDLLNTTFSSKPAIVMDHNPLGITSVRSIQSPQYCNKDRHRHQTYHPQSVPCQR